MRGVSQRASWRWREDWGHPGLKAESWILLEGERGFPLPLHPGPMETQAPFSFRWALPVCQKLASSLWTRLSATELRHLFFFCKYTVSQSRVWAFKREFVTVRDLVFWGKERGTTSFTRTRTPLTLWIPSPQWSILMSFWRIAMTSDAKSSVCTGALAYWWQTPSQATSLEKRVSWCIWPLRCDIFVASLSLCHHCAIYCANLLCFVVQFCNKSKTLGVTVARFGGTCLLRWKWSEECNVILPSLEPGGWSAHGQPQDACRNSLGLGIVAPSIASIALMCAVCLLTVLYCTIEKYSKHAVLNIL